MSEVFLDYSKYYDLLYRDKDYKGESNFIIDQIKKYKPHAKTILNLGCGTGQHDLFLAEAGYDITGVDLSEQMIEIAKAKNTKSNCHFLHGDARALDLNLQFDIVISLFHVLSYQNSNEEVSSFFQTIKKLLKNDGIAIVDYWYGPAVLNIKPENRTKEINSSEMHIKRIANTHIDHQKNIATVNYQIEILNKNDNKIKKLSENHPMRYFFSPELELFLEREGLKHLSHKSWLSHESPPSETSWAAYSVISR